VRVLVLSHMYPRVRHPAGGIFVHDQVRALRARGVDARVLSGDPRWVQTVDPLRVLATFRNYCRTEPVWGEWETVPVLHFPYLCGYWLRPSVHAMTYVLGLNRILSAACSQFPFDVIHAHTSFLDGSAGLSVRRACGRPLVITEHTGPFSLLTRNRFMKATTRRALARADHRIAVSDSLKSDIVEALGFATEMIETLPNGVDSRVFRPLGEGRRGRPDGLVRALWVGHFVEIKRVDRLLSAFAQASRIRPELRLTLVGEGMERAAMENLATNLGIFDRVAFRPACDRAGVADTMRAHDFLVVSSAKETFSLVTLEALTCGIPVLATACGGPEGLITEPSFGLVVRNDIEGLTQGLVTMPDRLMMSDPKFLHAHFGGRYSWARIAEELEALYRRLIGAAAQRPA
jgi:glycosyltransferase involved in cell wall biosynthesis